MIGGSIFDIVTSVSGPEIHSDGRTHPGSVAFGLGGVGREELIMSPCPEPGWRAWGRSPRKGRDQILQRSVAEP